MEKVPAVSMIVAALRPLITYCDLFLLQQTKSRFLLPLRFTISANWPNNVAKNNKYNVLLFLLQLFSLQQRVRRLIFLFLVPDCCFILFLSVLYIYFITSTNVTQRDFDVNSFKSYHFA